MASVVIAGDTSGAITLAAPAVAGTNTLSLPAVTDTLVGLAATQTLTNKSIAASQLTGTIAAARLPAGSIIQVVNTTVSTAVAFSGGFASLSGFSISITPSSASNKILYMVSIPAALNVGTAYNGGAIRVYRNGSVMLGQVVDSNRGQASFPLVAGQGSNQLSTNTWIYLDNPATTSSVTYSMQVGFTDGDGSGTINRTNDNTDNTENIRTQTNIFAIEVAA